MENIKKYFTTCEELREDFFLAYMGEYLPADERGDYWVGDDIGCILTWDDYFISMSNLVDYFVLDYTPEMFDSWYWSGMGTQYHRTSMKVFKKLYEEPPTEIPVDK